MQVVQTPEQRLLARFKELVEIAKRSYQVDLTNLEVSFNLRGRVAGWALTRKNNAGEVLWAKIKINRDMLHRVPDDMINETLPHEVAHIICDMRPELGYAHDAGWHSVCVALGGTGERLHTQETVHGKGRTFEYVTTTGETVRLNEKWQALLEAGVPLDYKKASWGSVLPGSTYYIVGVDGRTLAQKQGPFSGKRAASAGIAPASAGQTARVAEYRVTKVTRCVPTQAPVAGESKASISRRIMKTWYMAGKSYEEIIAEMMRVNGYDRQLARGTFKANAPKIGLPLQF